MQSRPAHKPAAGRERNPPLDIVSATTDIHSDVVIQTSQRAQIVRHVARLLDYLGVVEIPGSTIASASKRDRTNMALLARKRFRARHDRGRIEAFCWLACRDAIVGRDKRESDVLGHLGQAPRSYSIKCPPL
jgi:hypothetical protein